MQNDNGRVVPSGSILIYLKKGKDSGLSGVKMECLSFRSCCFREISMEPLALKLLIRRVYCNKISFLSRDK